MNIEEFKVYVRRDGERTGEMERNDSSVYCWIDPASGREYTEDGSYFTGSITPYDLVAEYHEPVIPTVDWDKPLELMDGTQARLWDARTFGAYFRANNGETQAFVTDAQGCIGGVQVIRNRADPKRYKGEVWANIYPDGGVGGFACKDHADEFGDGDRIACLRFEYDVAEGEGL